MGVKLRWVSKISPSLDIDLFNIKHEINRSNFKQKEDDGGQVKMGV